MFGTKDTSGLLWSMPDVLFQEQLISNFFWEDNSQQKNPDEKGHMA